MNRKEHIDAMAAIINRADAAGRDLTADERSSFDIHEGEARRLAVGGSAEPYLETRGMAREDRTEADKAFTRYLRTGEVRASSGLSTAPDNTQTGTDQAGFMIPQGFWMNLQIAQKQYGGIENDFRLVETPTGNPMPWPTIDPTAVTGGIVGTELVSAAPISPYVFGEGILNAWTVALNGPILASLQLVQDSAFDVDTFVAERIGEGIGRTLAQLAVSGTGSGQHQGIIPALNTKGAVGSGSGGFLGLTAATNVSTFGGTVTELAGNLLSPQTLIKMIGAVDPAYRPGAKFYVNDGQLEGMRSTVDGFGLARRPQVARGGGVPGSGTTRRSFRRAAL